MRGWGNVSALHGTLSPLWKSGWSHHVCSVSGGWAWSSMESLRAPWVRLCCRLLHGLLATGHAGGVLPCIAFTLCPVSASLCGDIASVQVPASDPCISWSCHSVATSGLFHQSPVVTKKEAHFKKQIYNIQQESFSTGLKSKSKPAWPAGLEARAWYGLTH